MNMDDDDDAYAALGAGMGDSDDDDMGAAGPSSAAAAASRPAPSAGELILDTLSRARTCYRMTLIGVFWLCPHACFRLGPHILCISL
jgi:hypothetical protein